MYLKPLMAALIFLFVLSGTFFIRVTQSTFDDSINNGTTIPPIPVPLENETIPPVQTPPPSTGISQARLAQHNSRDDCWIAYKGKVYDVTSYLGRHPGGTNAIARYCGTASEFEQAFTRQHGTSKAGLLVNVATFIGDFDIVGGFGG